MRTCWMIGVWFSVHVLFRFNFGLVDPGGQGDDRAGLYDAVAHRAIR